jgi:hypothetical protein
LPALGAVEAGPCIQVPSAVPFVLVTTTLACAAGKAKSSTRERGAHGPSRSRRRTNRDRLQNDALHRGQAGEKPLRSSGSHWTMRRRLRGGSSWELLLGRFRGGALRLLLAPDLPVFDWVADELRRLLPERLPSVSTAGGRSCRRCEKRLTPLARLRRLANGPELGEGRTCESACVRSPRSAPQSREGREPKGPQEKE